MARFCSLSSSSKGNCYYVSGTETSLLIDVGISCKQVRLQLEKHNLELSQLDGILITHEHTDHIRGLNVLLKSVNLPVYSAPETLDYLASNGLVPGNAQLIPVKEEFIVNTLKIKPFKTPHDAVYSQGYRIEGGDDRIIGIATDLGSVTPTVREHLEGCDMVLIESNFDHGMLNNSSYPYPLKLRIKSDNGHLANEDCASEVAHLVRTGSTRFVLGHLSEQNNIPELAYETTNLALKSLEMALGSDYLLEVAPARQTGSMVVF